MPIVCDIETVPHPCAVDFIPKPDLDAIKAAGNLKDPEKIAADLQKRKDAAESEYVDSLSRAALDWNVSQICALGYTVDAGETVLGGVCRDEQDEASALREFWDVMGRQRYGRLIGFRIRTFDAPTIVQRSRLLGLVFPQLTIAPYGRGDILDLFDVLTFDQARRDPQLMPCSLKMFAKRFGLPVEDETTGADVAGMVAAGDYDAVWRHCTSDVRLTAALGKRIGVLHGQPIGAF